MGFLTEALADINGVDYDARAQRLWRIIEDRCDKSNLEEGRKKRNYLANTVIDMMVERGDYISYREAGAFWELCSRRLGKDLTAEKPSWNP